MERPISPSFSKRNLALVEPPTDFSRIPIEVTQESALKLDYEDIINLCKTSTKYAKLCQNPYFWKRKIERDFPDETIPNLEGPQYRAFYENLLADEYLEKILILTDDKIRDRRLMEMSYQVRKIAGEQLRKENPKARISSLKQEGIIAYAKQTEAGKELLKERKEILDSYDNKIKPLKEKAQKLRKRARKIFPIITEKKYIPIDIDKTEDEFINTEVVTASRLKKFLKTKGYNAPINRGNLFGFINRKISDNPSILIYVAADPNTSHLWIKSSPIDDPSVDLDYTNLPIIMNKIYLPTLEGENKFKKDYPELDVIWPYLDQML
jgi:hypothetical protein